MEAMMGTPMYASAPTCNGQWYSVVVSVRGSIASIIPGVFTSKAEADQNARRFIGSR
jgi:hypothetical protein